MNYRHIYHSGNFSDVVKHFVLTLIMQKMCEKDAPFCAIDSHAGIGLYDLGAHEVSRTLEYRGGIKKLCDQGSVDPVFKPYLDAVHVYNRGIGDLQWYPGSPCIMRAFLRQQDRLLLSELHPIDCETLKKNFRHDAQVQIFHQDGYVSLRALLPPLERRGVVLIDPPFEKKEEFDLVLKGILEAYRRFSTGIYLVWHPLKDRKGVQKFYDKLSAAGIAGILAVEFLVEKVPTSTKLNGCGLVIINPPWQLEEALTSSLKVLASYLGCHESGETKVMQLT